MKKSGDKIVVNYLRNLIKNIYKTNKNNKKNKPQLKFVDFWWRARGRAILSHANSRAYWRMA